MADMNSQKFRDMRDGAVGFVAALAFGGSCIMILLGALGFFDHGTTYKFPQTATKEHRR